MQDLTAVNIHKKTKRLQAVLCTLWTTIWAKDVKRRNPNAPFKVGHSIEKCQQAMA